MLYEELWNWDHLLAAYRRAARGKRSRPAVAAFEYHLEDNLLALQAELRDQSYRPGAYTSFYIHDPKRRLISAAPFRDRVVHHALCALMEPLYERRFISDSYANRVGKGTHRALDRFQDFARRYRYVLQGDIRQFFPAVDHALLLAILARVVDEPPVLWLVEQILAGGVGVLHEEYDMVYFPGDGPAAVLRPRGLPIGNLTSQFWANCYLNPFDHFVKRELRCLAYLRYVDDWALFANDKAQLWEWRAAVVERLAGLRLTIHAGAQPRPVTEGAPFSGFTVFPTYRRLKRRRGVAFQRRLRRLLAAQRAGQVSPARVTAAVQGWVNHARYGATWGLRRRLLGMGTGANSRR